MGGGGGMTRVGLGTEGLGLGGGADMAQAETPSRLATARIWTTRRISKTGPLPRSCRPWPPGAR